MAVISSESLGAWAFISGRYAKRCARKPTAPARHIAAIIENMIPGHPGTIPARAPNTARHTNAPVMKMSPCAKFKSLMIP